MLKVKLAYIPIIVFWIWSIYNLYVIIDYWINPYPPYKIFINISHTFYISLGTIWGLFAINWFNKIHYKRNLELIIIPLVLLLIIMLCNMIFILTE